MRCNICGAEMDDAYSFCLACGAKLVKIPPEPEEFAADAFDIPEAIIGGASSFPQNPPASSADKSNIWATLTASGNTSDFSDIPAASSNNTPSFSDNPPVSPETPATFWADTPVQPEAPAASWAAAPVEPEAPAASWADTPFEPEAPAASSAAAFVEPEAPAVSSSAASVEPEVAAVSSSAASVEPEAAAVAVAAAVVAAQPTPQPPVGESAKVEPVTTANPVSAPPPPKTTAPPHFFDDNLAPIVSVGNWLVTLLLLLLIPIAAAVIAGIVGSLLESNWITNNLSGLVMIVAYLFLILFYAFNKRTNPSKRNFFRATIIYTLIIIIITVVLVFALGAMLMNYLDEMGIQDIDQMMQLIESSI